MNTIPMKAAALALLGGSLQVAAQLTICGTSSNADFEYEASPTDGLTMYWSIDADAETVSFQVVSDASAWAALGFPESGIDLVGSEAVIGLPANESVMEYDLTGESVDEWILFDTQDITETSVTQDDTGTTISFTRPLAPGGDKESISATPGDTTAFIYAVGTSNELDNDYVSGGFRLDVFCGSGADDIVPRTPSPIVGGDMTAAPTAATAASTSPTETPLAAGSTTAPGSTPAPSGADGDRGIGGTSVGPTPAPAAADAPTAPGTAPETAGPSSLEDTDGQGDSDGAFRVGAGGWAASAVATGVAGVLAALFL